MSTIRDPAVITTAGRQMMTAGGDITYTKAILYGQDISHLTKEQLAGLTSIGSPLLTVPVGISDKNDVGANTTVVLEATFQNTNLKADLPYTAVGFFAKRGDDAEKLVAVGVATDGAYLAATSPDGIATDALDIKVAIAIGDSANVTAMIDPAGSVTPTELHNTASEIRSEMHTALDLKADKVDLEPLAKTADVQAGLDTKANKTAVDSDVNSVNATVSALQQTVKAFNDTISSANATIKTLQDTITKQATTITGLQTQISNQAQDIAYIKANYIEGKRFAKADESQATAWEKENSQRIAFITDN